MTEPAPKPTSPAVPSKTDHDLRMEIWNESYKLALGPISGRAKALENVIHLATVLQHVTLEPNKET